MMREKLAAMELARQAIEEARYAMVGGNLDGEPVPPEVIVHWLDYIEEAVTPPVTGTPVVAEAWTDNDATAQSPPIIDGPVDCVVV